MTPTVVWARPSPHPAAPMQTRAARTRRWLFNDETARLITRFQFLRGGVEETGLCQENGGFARGDRLVLQLHERLGLGKPFWNGGAIDDDLPLDGRGLDEERPSS